MLCSAATIFPTGPRDLRPGRQLSLRRAQLTALGIPIDLGAGRDARPLPSTDRGAYGDPDWEADVAQGGRQTHRG
jgi:hypothetical protein